MISRKICQSVGVLAFAAALPLSAQQLQSVSEAKDWTVFVNQSNAKHCYVVSAPTSSRALDADGSEKEVNRGDIRLYVGIKNGATEPSFMAGYPLANDKAVAVKIGGQNFSYLTNPSANAEFAWPQPQNDSAIIGAMKAGAEVEVVGKSKRGTTTVDKFSLSGFTAAYNAAVEHCK